MILFQRSTHALLYNTLSRLLLLVVGLLYPAVVRGACRSPEAKAANNSRCLQYLRSLQGHFSSPGFPAAFAVPFECSWVIDASHSGYQDPVIVLYLTQVYLKRGIHIVEHSFFNETFTRGRRERKLKYLEKPVSVMKFRTRFLEVQLSLQDLVNVNLRVQDRLVDVYGFNITYEIHAAQPKIRQDVCNAFNCSFNGHCYASKDYSQFQCSCLPGFYGRYCQNGPECDPLRGINLCRNGGICRYIYGSSIVRCHCPLHFNGTTCEFRREIIPASECWHLRKVNCSHHCVSSGSGDLTCGCPQGYALKSDNATCYKLTAKRLTVQLNLSPARTNNDRPQLRRTLQSELEKLIREVSANQLSMGAINFLSDWRVKFHLWSSETMVNNTMWRRNLSSQSGAADDSRLMGNNRFLRLGRNRYSRAVIEDRQWPNAVNATVKMLARNRLLNGEVAITNVSYQEVSTLEIEWIQTDAVDGRVRQGYPLTVACKSSGSRQLQVTWFKDGIRIDPEKSLREMEIGMLAPTLLGHYTSYLVIKRATAADRGQYECRVTDWDQQASQNLFIEVLTPPRLEIRANSTTYNGSIIVLTCIDDNDLARRIVTSYTWLRKGTPVNSSCTEIVEDLYPVGNLLKIYHLENSTEYTCRAVSEAGISNASIRLAVSGSGKVCPPETVHGIGWTETPTGFTDHKPCPAGLDGVAGRFCGEAGRWLSYDFSGCIPRVIGKLRSELKLITLGYAISTVPSVVHKLRGFLEAKSQLLSEARDGEIYPGEGASVVHLVSSLLEYFQNKTNVLEKNSWNSTAVEYLENIDFVLSMPAEYLSEEMWTSLMTVLQDFFVLFQNRGYAEIPTNFQNFFFHWLNQSDSQWSASVEHKKAVPVSKNPSLENLQMVSPPVFRLSDPLADPSPSFTVFFNNSKSSQDYKNLKCAILPVGESLHWNFTICSLNSTTKSGFLCRCSKQGTVAIVTFTNPQDQANLPQHLQPISVILLALAFIFLIISLAVVIRSFCRSHALWAWSHIQLNLSLMAVAGFFLISTGFQVILMSGSVYIYVCTVLAMVLDFTIDRVRKYRYLVYIVLTAGVPLTAVGVHSVLGSLTGTDSCRQLEESHLRFTASCSALLMILTAYLLTANLIKTRAKKQLKSPNSRKKIFIGRRCLQGILGEAVSALTLIAVVVYSRCHGNRNQTTSTVLILISALIQMTLSFISGCSEPISREQSAQEAPIVAQENPASSRDSLEATVAPGSSRNALRRPGRLKQASTPLLCRAGLGPEVQRAFLDPESLAAVAASSSGGLPEDPAETDSGLGASGNTANEALQLQTETELLQETAVQSEDHEECSQGEESEGSSTNLKPFRGRCFIQCSPEYPSRSSPKNLRPCVLPAEFPCRSPKKCERCWQNPETPPCNSCFPDSFIREGNHLSPACARGLSRAGKDADTESQSSEYLEMDAAGSLAVGNYEANQIYSNLIQGERISQRLFGSVPTIPRCLKQMQKKQKFSSGKIIRKHRLSNVRSLVNSTFSLAAKINGHSRMTETRNSRIFRSTINL